MNLFNKDCIYNELNVLDINQLKKSVAYTDYYAQAFFLNQTVLQCTTSKVGLIPINEVELEGKKLIDLYNKQCEWKWMLTDIRTSAAGKLIYDLDLKWYKLLLENNKPILPYVYAQIVLKLDNIQSYNYACGNY